MDLKKVLEEGELKTDKKFTPLLLGDGKNAEEIRILKQIGFKEEIEVQEDLLGQQVSLDKIKDSYKTSQVYSLNNILKICDQYHMIFAPVKANKNKNIDVKEVVAKIIEFNTKFEKSTDNVQQDFFVLSTSNLFAGKTKPFMLFYKPDASNNYILVYSSEDVIKERRKILGKVFHSEDSINFTVFMFIVFLGIFFISRIDNIGIMMLNHYILTIIISLLTIPLLYGILIFSTDAILYYKSDTLSAIGERIMLNDYRCNNSIMLKNIKDTTVHQANESAQYNQENETYYQYYYSQYIKFRKNESKKIDKNTIA